ncbi:MAG: hypothetical protein A2945_00480 [Candidatus Liptonbacteria bacterium RIFCSPLOWO2_01_FULL_52_25]|uniref:Glycosyltransferase subfamily 4-like N-terminal domain-containing protein n=1 Tax=Candidatus Liptonbacteria bacterium RIFCSPLOWO2_01_FULL_52_25 TaxID=1798650 RepID=A0A1G2CFI1_9BACT|nr:MAG: hypothetical protein A2945_00480 [Candidatus Liptonbacteria bacterium RIFCSPLOWO2_01_FULL_52_25]
MAKIVLTHFNLTTESGDPKMLLSIAQGLKKLGHTVTIYCAEFDPEACFPRLNQGLDVRVAPPPKPLSSVRGAIGLLAKILERIKQARLYHDAAQRIAVQLKKDLDFVIVENDYTYKAAAAHKKENPKAKTVWIMNNPPFFHSKKRNFTLDILSRVANLFEKWSAKKYAKYIDWIVVYDENFRRLAGTLGRPVKVLRNPVDVDYFFAPPKRGIRAGEKIQLLSLGALSPNRRFEDTISAVKILRDKGYNAGAVIICKDYWGNKQYRESFENFIKNSGVAGYVDARFQGASEEEYLDAIRTSDVFILPNNIKNWAVGAFEAMAAGVPLVVSRATAVSEILHDGKDALFVDVLRPDEIAEKVEFLAKDAGLYVRIASAGQELVIKDMSLNNFAKKILEPPQA